jgi:hypothetical protein
MITTADDPEQLAFSNPALPVVSKTGASIVHQQMGYGKQASAGELQPVVILPDNKNRSLMNVSDQ